MRNTADKQPANRITLLLCILGALALFALGALLSPLFFDRVSVQRNVLNPRPVRLGAEGLINPLLYTDGGKAPSTQLEPLRSALAAAIADDVRNGLAVDVGVYAHELKTGQWTGVNESEKFSPASMLKVPVMLAYLKAAEANPDILDDRLRYDNPINLNASEDIKPLKTIERGAPYTADELLAFMIQYSDNNAMALLINHLGEEAVKSVYTDLQIPYPTSTVTSDFLNPRQYSRFFRVLYSATYVNRELSEKALKLLAYPDFPQGLQAGVPSTVTVAAKFGERYFFDADLHSNRELSDCGIVYHPERPYFLCIMTKGNDFVKLGTVIRDVSAAAWRSITGDESG